MKKLKNIKKKEKQLENHAPPAKIKITDPVMIANALVNCEGNEYNTAESLGITAKTLRKHIKNNDVLAEIKDHILSKQICFAEEKLMKLINLGDFQAIKYFLDSRGKDYGYGKNAVQDGQTHKTGVLLINNMTVNNGPLNPDDWSQAVLQQRGEQKKILDQQVIDLGLKDDDD